MSTPTPTVRCANPQCRVAETGKCVEGLALEKCPSYGRAPEPLPAEAPPSAPVPAKPDGVALPAGELVALDAAPDVLRRRENRVIAVLGGREAGKTSLVASLFGLFQDGPVGAFCFAGSDTLIAFERACHDARAASERSVPHFERTSFSGTGLYQLAICRTGDPAATDLLVADRAGEDYVGVGDTPANARLFGEVRRADTVTVLVDGHRLVDVTARHNLRSELQLMLQALADNDAFSGRQRLAVVLTKLDEVIQAPHKARTHTDFEKFCEAVRQRFGDRFSDLKPFTIAASPMSGVARRGHGVAELFEFWMLPSSQQQSVVPERVAAARAFGRLALLDG